jgi:hypothetical protein
MKCGRCAKSRTCKSWSPAARAVIPSRYSLATNRVVRSLTWTALALAAFVSAAALVAAAPTPPPLQSQRAALPKVPLHVEVVVEVNSRGQVVRVQSTKPSKVQGFNIQTYGNALQMWIRHPDGTAQVGLYRVTYDYEPKSQEVTRRVALISAGGNWANEPGAATVMINLAKKQAQEAERQAEEQNTKLPSLNQIRGVPASPKPTAAATLPPL